MRRLHRKHGAILRIAPDEVSISDPSAIHKIYDARGTFVKTELYDVWEGHISKYPNLFAVRDEALHAARRKILNHVYSMTAVLESERYIDNVTETFMRRMDVFARSGKSFELSEWLER